MTINEALTKAMKLCSVKEYAPSEIEQKLKSWEIPDEAVHSIITTLTEEKFLDEFRMARYFVNDKIRFNKWGRVKIKFMLQQKKLTPEVITEALNQVNEEKYLETLLNELVKKKKTIKDTDEYKIKAKLFQFASGRGFEADIIYKMMDKIVK
jgi:regulatory protein